MEVLSGSTADGGSFDLMADGGSFELMADGGSLSLRFCSVFT
jgi:hypothetical protein